MKRAILCYCISIAALFLFVIYLFHSPVTKFTGIRVYAQGVFELSCPLGTSSLQSLQTTDNVTGKLRQNYCVDNSGNVTENSSAGLTQNVAIKPITTDGYMFISTGGSSLNDGQSAGSAKASIQTTSFLYEFISKGTFQTNTEIALGQSDILQGQGVLTIIQAGSSFPASTPIFELSNVGASEFSQLNNMIVDCNGKTGATGVLNDNAQENSGLFNVSVASCPNFGVDWESASQNSSLEHVVVGYNVAGSSNAATIPIKINATGQLREARDITITATGQGTSPNVGMLINSSGNYSNIHCEAVVMCISVTASGVVIDHVDCHPSVTTCVSIASGVANVTLRNIAASAGNQIVDIGNGYTLTVGTDPAGVGWYIVGANGSPQGACSSSTNVTCNAIKGATRIYTSAGTLQLGNPHLIQDTATLTAGTVTVTFTGNSIFTNATSYSCTADDDTAIAATHVVQNSGSSITITGTGADVIRYICAGN